MPAPLRVPIDVRFGDVDFARIVYYPRYLHFFHVAFEEFWKAVAGIPYARVMEEHGLGFPAVRIEVEFEQPLRFGDVAEIVVGIEHVGTSSIRWRYGVERGGAAAGMARITTVTMDMAGFTKIATPEWVLDLLRRYQAAC